MEKDVQDYIYILRLEYKERNKLKVNYFTLCLLICVITFSIGYLDTKCLSNPIVLISYSLSILPVAFLMIGCFNIVGMVDFMAYNTYKKAFIWTKKLIKVLFVLFGICAGTMIVLLMVYFVKGKIDSYLHECLFLAGMIADVVLNCILYKYHQKNMKLIYEQRKGNKDEKSVY